MEFIIECFEVGVLLILIVATWLREFMELLYSVFRGLCFHSYFLLRHSYANNLGYNLGCVDCILRPLRHYVYYNDLDAN